MAISAASAVWFFAGLALLAVGIVLRRHASRLGPPPAPLHTAAWFALILGYALLGMLALAHLGGRFGPAQLWFRAPTFYLGTAILLAGAIWWITRPASRFVRFGIPSILLGGAVLVLGLMRLHGASAPLAMLLPTMSRPAPELTWVDLTGGEQRLSQLRGKVVLVNFWATWCTPCRREMPMLSGMQQRFGQDGFVVVYLSLEEPQVVEAFLARNRFDGINGRLDAAPEFYGAGKFYPLSFLIDRDGHLEQRWSGRPDERWLADAIRAEL